MCAEMGHLTERVNARVRAARAVQRNLFLCDLARSFVEGALNRGHARLHLPTVETCAVISDDELYIPHRCRNYRTRQLKDNLASVERSPGICDNDEILRFISARGNSVILAGWGPRRHGIEDNHRPRSWALPIPREPVPANS